MPSPPFSAAQITKSDLEDDLEFGDLLRKKMQREINLAATALGAWPQRFYTGVEHGGHKLRMPHRHPGGAETPSLFEWQDPLFEGELPAPS